MPGPNLITHSLTLTANGKLVWEAEDTLEALSVQVEGDFGGGSVHLLVSNDNVHFHALPNEGGRSFSAPGVKTILHEDTCFLWFKVILSGSTNPNLTITCVERKS